MSCVQVTGTVQRAAWRAGVLPPVEQVRPGMWSIPVPIPDNPLRYTLSYAIESAGRLVVVDPGWPSDAGWSALVDGLGAAGARVSDVAGIVVTHVHLDHHGLSARLREASNAWVAMHAVEWSSLPTRAALRADSPAEEAWLAHCGVPPAERGRLALNRSIVERIDDLAPPDVLLEHGDGLPGDGRRLRVVWTPGHTPGHVCLYDRTEDVLLTGDHLLPRITPNIGLHPHATVPPLAGYLRSLAAIVEHATAEALPAHEYRFRGVDDRARALIDHHEARCREIVATLDRGTTATVWQVAERIGWSRDWPQVTGTMRRAALAETAAHLALLVERGTLRREGTTTWGWSVPPGSLR